MKAIKFTLLLVLLSIQFGQAQSLKAWLKAADTSYVQGDYYAAYKYYETALEYDTANVDVWYKLGKSASAFNAYAYAERAFLKTEKLDKDTLYKDIHCELGEVRQKMGKFNEAIRNFDKCIAQNGLPANVIEDAR